MLMTRAAELGMQSPAGGGHAPLACMHSGWQLSGIMMPVMPLCWLLLQLAAAAAAADPAADELLVQQHVRSAANATFRPPSGVLKYPVSERQRDYP
eukprot:SAG22_NODE_1810_length_3525_cov_13.151781_3_plen_96_part_00